MRDTFCHAWLLLIVHGICGNAIAEDVVLREVSMSDDAVLHYVERGEGDPVIFVHGLLDDYSTWLWQLDGFSRSGYRAIAYSRRHNYPNENRIRPNHSASLEADDLAELVRTLKLKRVHVVGCSYGAYTALCFALKHPDLARTITLAEPPLVPWLADLPDHPEAGQAQLAMLVNQGIEPAKVALKSGDEEAAIRAMFDVIGGKGKFDSLPIFVKQKCRRNVQELRAFISSDDRYPNVNRDHVRRIAVPTLILSGSRSVATAHLTDPELERLIPAGKGKRVVFKDATHIIWIEQPVQFREE